MTRTDLLRNKMNQLGVDSLIVCDELNQRYLTNFAFTDGYVLLTPKGEYMLTDFRYLEMAKARAFSHIKVLTPDDMLGALADIMRSDGASHIGFEGTTLSYAAYLELSKRLSFAELKSIGRLIEEQREVKDESEISAIQKAQDITDAAFSALLKVLTPNMTEIEVAAELEYNMRRLGADGLAFETIAVSSEASALPHGTPRNQKLGRGFLTMDFGAKYDGYCADMTRTVVIGKAHAAIKKLYDTVLRAQLAGVDYLRSGVDCADADRVARDIIDAEEEYRGTFGHSLGHGVGLFIHEEPRLSKKGKGRLLRVGEVVTVEPGIYLYGKYGCRIEDTVAICESGVRNFAHSTKELIEIL